MHVTLGGALIKNIINTNATVKISHIGIMYSYRETQKEGVTWMGEKYQNGSSRNRLLR
jgi:hypothetical protein